MIPLRICAIVILTLILLHFLTSAQDSRGSSPRVLNYSESSRYIGHLRVSPLRIEGLFGQHLIDTTAFREIPEDSISFQVFEFPNKVVAVGFAQFTHSGMAIFRTDTDTVLEFYSWVGTLIKDHPDDFKEHFDVGTTYYQFYPLGDHWELVTLVLVQSFKGIKISRFYLDLKSLQYGIDGLGFVPTMRH
jgi:hypothetical protein